jgi:hypothetical protein
MGKKKAKPATEPAPVAVETEQKTKKLSMIAAAKVVLRASVKPMRCQDIIAAMSCEGLWDSPNGKTPHTTLYSALIREIRENGRKAHFKRVGVGLFTVSKVGHAS